MVTPAPARRLAHAAVALAVGGPAVLLGGVAWADPTPAPADDTSTQAPLVQPSIGTWIIGGTLLESTSTQATKAVTKPAAAPPAATRPTRTTTRTAPRTVAPTTPRSTGAATTGMTALPFTGNHVDALLPAGITMLVGGIVLTVAGRPRRSAA